MWGWAPWRFQRKPAGSFAGLCIHPGDSDNLQGRRRGTLGNHRSDHEGATTGKPGSAGLGHRGLPSRYQTVLRHGKIPGSQSGDPAKSRPHCLPSFLTAGSTPSENRHQLVPVQSGYDPLRLPRIPRSSFVLSQSNCVSSNIENGPPPGRGASRGGKDLVVMEGTLQEG